MSVQSETSRVQYVGNNSSSTPYPVPFYFLENSHLVVVLTDADGVDATLDFGTDYTVAGAGEEDGGEIVTAAAWDNTHTITIYREVPATQTTVYDENADFPAKSHERALDKLTMLVQQVARAASLAIRLTETQTPIDPLGPVPSTAIGFDALGALRTLTPEEFAVWLNLTQQYYGEGTKTFLNDADRAAAVPDFLGQLGVQVDTSAPYVSNGLTAGDWTQMAFTPGAGSITAAMLAATLNLTGKTLTLPASQIVGTSQLVDASATLAKLAASAKMFRTGTRGLRIAYASASTLTIDVSEIVMGDGSGGYVRFDAPSTQTVDITTTGANGRDGGSEASSTWYYVWAISDGTNFRGLLSTSDTAPTMPSGYTYKLLVGVVRNNGSSDFVAFMQNENQIWTAAQQVFTSKAGTTSFSTESISAFVPPNARTVRGNGNASGGTGNYGMVIVGDSATSGAWVGFGRNILNAQNSGSAIDGFRVGIPFMVPIKTAQTIYWKTDTTTSTYALEITGYTL